MSARRIELRGARAHNLAGLDVTLPRHALIAVTGVSGSGKSSFAFDTVFREGERRYLATLAAPARRLLAKLGRPEVDAISGLGAAVAVGQRGPAPNPRSTVGTATGLWDLLRLLFARLGDPKTHRGLFSFNDPEGQCPTCRGLGVVDQVDPALIVQAPQRTLRGGALVPTLKSGYTVYSQVTVEVMDQVCRAHGFDVDTPWQDLTDAQRDVVMYGSQRLVVPYGKHSLESRMRWSGITARPREEGYYRGLVPVIEETLARNRNDNVLRFVRSVPCAACGGARLGPAARAVRFRGLGIADLGRRAVRDVATWAAALRAEAGEAAVLGPIQAQLAHRTQSLLRLGLGHLPLERDAPSLSTGEHQRLRLAQQLEDDLAGLTYVLDEPSVDLHPADRGALQAILRDLVAAGNTVLTVEHDLALVAAADHVVDIGPGPGAAGGRLLYQGPPAGLVGLATPTGRAMAARPGPMPPARRPAPDELLWVRGARARNLAGIDVAFLKGAVNVVSGVSGAGKTTLVHGVLAPAVRGDRSLDPGALRGLEGAAGLGVVALDQRPLGRTPRSNPATYTKLFDIIRAAFAQTEAARARGFDKGRFSFNTEGGRCPTCEGAGVQMVGMHFLGDVTVPCPTCDGRRFDADTLAVTVGGLDVAQVLALSVDAARAHFAALPEARRILDALAAVGLGYVQLGQPADTLSGGEAQRVRLAAELARPIAGPTLYLLDEPTRGLHPADLPPVQAALRRLAEAGHTVVVVEHNPEVWRAADWLIDLGPGGGEDGGRLLYAGPVAGLAGAAGSATAAYLAAPPPLASVASQPAVRDIQLRGVRTHNLKGIDVTFPTGQLTVVCGPSGSGKSSLVFDTLAAEASRRLVGRLSAHVRRLARRLPAPELEAAEGLTATVALRQRRPAPQPRSTVGTVTEAQDLLRLLFSRVGAPAGLPASAFSFNTEHGACPRCRGLGLVLRADPERVISDPSRPLLDGAAAGTKLGAHLTEPDGQHAAILMAAAQARGLAVSGPFAALTPEAQALVLEGAPEPQAVVWAFKRGKRTGEHRFTAAWPGLLALVEEAHAKAHLEEGDESEALMRKLPCEACAGCRLAPGPRSVRVAGLALGEVNATPVAHLGAWLEALPQEGPAQVVAAELRPRLEALVALGLGHLALGRGADTLSAGELQRVHLAAQLGARGTQLTFALDEPSRGLHPVDVGRLAQVLLRLRAEGNTVVVVDHHPALRRIGDGVVELGPGSGAEGGYVGHSEHWPRGTRASGVPATTSSPTTTTTTSTSTGPDHSRRERERERRRADAAPVPHVHIVGARAQNLRADVALPLHGVTALVGPSGSGKSTLIREVLLPSHRAGRPVGCVAFSGLSPEVPVHHLDQGPLPDGELAVPATVLGLFEGLRSRFARSSGAKQAGLTKAMFSFRQGNGRCPVCKGAGRVVVPLDFLADARGPCEACGGRRYRPEVLACQVEGRSIADVLDLSLAEAGPWLGDPPAVALAVDLGLGHLALGRPASTLSGGEAQRLKLAEVLSQPAPLPALFVLDEPSAGLDPARVLGLQSVLRRTVEAGHRVLMVTHDLTLVAGADHVVELGPGGGPEGGAVVFEGPPGALAKASTATGRALAEVAR
jgi:excinuclease ABC subunit A